jgi:hypothetical protein
MKLKKYKHNQVVSQNNKHISEEKVKTQAQNCKKKKLSKDICES